MSWWPLEGLCYMGSVLVVDDTAGNFRRLESLRAPDVVSWVE